MDGANGKGWDGLEVLNFLINSVTIVVVAIPEGLPLAITLGRCLHSSTFIDQTETFLGTDSSI